MRALLCIAGGVTGEFLDRALVYAAAPTQWVAVYVQDTGPEMHLSALRHAMPCAGPLRPHQRQNVEAASAQRARNVQNEIEAAFRQRGLRLERFVQAEGEPGREICRVAESERIELVIVRARTRPGPASGPPSVGHTARFVLDHAPCPVLLLRGV